MKKVLFLSTLAFLGTTSSAWAQFGPVRQPPNQWVTGWVGGNLSPGKIQDHESGTEWAFGSGVGFGGGIHRRVGGSLVLGLEASYSPMRTEIRDLDTSAMTPGTSKVVTALASGRLRYGGGDSFGMYLTGGAGTMMYGVPAPVDRWDPDLALYSGTGVEYRPNDRRAVFVEWGRFWTFHQRDGVQDNTTKSSQLRVGGRMGW
jgi:hypothetical protein